MPARKPPRSKQVVLQLYNLAHDNQVVALLIDELLVAFCSTLRVSLPGYDDLLFLRITGDNCILYDGVTYTDYSVSTVEEATEWLAKSGIPIVPFDPSQATE